MYRMELFYEGNFPPWSSRPSPRRNSIIPDFALNTMHWEKKDYR